MSRKYNIYKEQQYDIFLKLLNILELKENEEFIINEAELDNNEDKQEQIINLTDSIKKFFYVGNVSCFKKNRKEPKKIYISIALALFKIMGYNKDETKIINKKNVNYIYKLTKI